MPQGKEGSQKGGHGQAWRVPMSEKVVLGTGAPTHSFVPKSSEQTQDIRLV